MAFLFLLSLATYVSSAPIAPVASVSPTPSNFNNALAAGEDGRVGWVPGPGGRGTSQVILSCCVTLVLCIWTTIHPDIIHRKPKVGKGTRDGKVGKGTGDGKVVEGTVDDKAGSSRPSKETPDNTRLATQSPGANSEITAVDDKEYPGGGKETTIDDPEAGGGKETTIDDPEEVSCEVCNDVFKPQRDISVWERFRNRAYLSFKALLMPEELLTDARSQWAHASRLHRAMIAGHYILHHTKLVAINEGKEKVRMCAFEEQEAPPECCNPRPSSPKDGKSPKGGMSPKKWDIFGKDVTFFVVQGGFVRSECGSVISPLDFYFAFMTDPENLRKQINVRDILDKGNASVIAKVIVSGQAGWYILNFLARVCSGLPIAPLELHVTVHLVLTLIMYMFWWHKQLDVNEPINLTAIPHYDDTETWATDPIEAVWPTKGLLWDCLYKIRPVPPEYTKEKPEWESAITEINKQNKNRPPPLRKASTYHCGMNEKGIFQGIISEWLPKLGQDQNKTDTKSHQENPQGESKGPQISVARSPDSQSQKDARSPDSQSQKAIKFWKQIAPSCAFYLSYAGLHATLWNSDFPTTVERWIWRASCLLIASTPFLTAFLIRIFDRLKKGALEKEGLGQKVLISMLFIIYLGGAWMLLGESFASLRSQLPGVYRPVDFSIYFPHI